MRLCIIERIIMRLLASSAAPLSIAELAERSGFRFVPQVIITLAVETLQQKKLIQEAGIHRSYAGGKEHRTVLYAPSTSWTEGRSV